MKILELRFKNLNSLYGEWFIDFTSPEYISNGIFALTGSTGTGKSTILDAICLALYGATPRLGKITKSGNEIMSRQTGSCYAEVTFESQHGRFRSHWSQHRARKKAGGNLCDSKHEISDVKSGMILESKKRDVASVIEEKTGMDFERFTRSMLLAQGGFDTFLKADIEQKSKILEQITGTEIYTEISKRVHERQRDEYDKLNILQAEISGVIILSEEQEVDLNKDLNEKQKKEADIVNKVLEAGKSIIWLKGIDVLHEEINSLSVESEKLRSELEIFKPERERLSGSEKAAELDGHYANLTSVRKQQNEDKLVLKSEEVEFLKLESFTKEKEEEFKKNEQLIVSVKGEQKAITPLIQQIRTLDLQLNEKNKSIESGDIDFKKAEEQITEDENLLEQEKKEKGTDQNELKLIQDYLKINIQDEFLVGGLAGIEEQLNNLLLVQKDISEKKDLFVKAEVQLKSDIKSFTVYTGQLTTCKRN
jgi:exonuclease SbcC